MKIFFSHIKLRVKEKGKAKTIHEIIRLLPKVVSIMRYNFEIKSKAVKTKYHFFHRGEQSNILTQAGFSVLLNEEVYANQNELVLAVCTKNNNQ